MQPAYTMEVSIAADKMSAELILHAEDADLVLREEELADELQKRGVVYGLDRALLQHVCQTPRKYIDVPLTIARGKAPTPGKDAWIEYTCQTATAQEGKPKELEDGRVDYYNVTRIANVTRGQLLARKHPAVPGEEGITVTGEKVAPPPAKDIVIRPGKNVVLNEEKTLLYATIDGQVSLTENQKINVFPVYEVNGDVNFNVGNIDFVGTVVIRGNVPTGFRVKASGDIRIYGSVEGAEIEAGGSIEIKNGIAAQDKGHVKAGVDLICSYIQNGNVYAGRDVIVYHSIMFSQVRAGKSVTCTRTKGIIIGGTIQAGEKITARVIGNQSSTPTVLEVGAKPELRNELKQVNQQMQANYENLRKTKQALSVLDQIVQLRGELPPEKKAMQIKLTNTRIMLEKELKELEARKNEIEAELDGDSPAVVTAQVVMYPGIKLVFGKQVRFIKQEFSRTRFLVLEGEITSSPLY
ncbi:FapA family protein [Brevibacillus marinus]|uniref:FapA family protein n=1 Tax=Brevibacillus marinus TaxID=2496837 RepID=UPI000F83B32D|nr:FapA family protein [Brevibacillus marinus]